MFSIIYSKPIFLVPVPLKLCLNKPKKWPCGVHCPGDFEMKTVYFTPHYGGVQSCESCLIFSRIYLQTEFSEESLTLPVLHEAFLGVTSQFQDFRSDPDVAHVTGSFRDFVSVLWMLYVRDKLSLALRTKLILAEKIVSFKKCTKILWGQLSQTSRGEIQLTRDLSLRQLTPISRVLYILILQSFFLPKSK